MIITNLENDNTNLANENVNQSIIHQVFEWLDVVAFSILFVVIIFTFLFRIVSIDGDSMQNTLHDKERIIISNLFFEPKYGDIVVISKNIFQDTGVEAYSKPIIKRVIATEGQEVDIDFDKGIVKVDGKVLNEPYIKEPTKNQLGVTFPVTVPENCVFVMGDNRNNSMDSRSPKIGDNGMINKNYILGHAVFRIFPFNKFGELIHK